MSLIFGSGAFATIVGLINQYRSIQESRDSKDAKDFENWLNENRYSDVVDLLVSDSKTLSGVDELIKEDHEIFHQKLDAINMALAAFASTIPGFGIIAEAVIPNNGLSDQAISILKQMEDIEATSLLKSATFGGENLIVIQGNSGGEIVIEDKRFLTSDLTSLVKLDLLIESRNGKGQPLYTITREAVNLVKAIEKTTR